MSNAAERLVGLSLSDGWIVKRHLARNPNGTGGTFSQSYEVVKDEKTAFLKAFDFQEAFESSDPARALFNMTSAFNHERDVLEHCQRRRLSNVVTAIDQGNVIVPGLGPIEGRVFYLIFEMASTDVRCQMSLDSRQGSLWCMQALRDVCLGLLQVHREMIAHQDTKPSNVLSFSAGGFKVADFGRASRKGHPALHDSFNIAGDKGYAPPELLYGFMDPDFMPRRVGCDMYMLGNLAAFLFSGVNVTASILSRLDPQHHPTNWSGTYAGVLPYVQASFTKVLEDLRPSVGGGLDQDITVFIRELCNPDYARRGHPASLMRHDQYSLERYVSKLTRLVMRVQIACRTERKAS